MAQDDTTSPLRVISLFSGIEGIGLGLERAGMRVVQQVEIDPFCNRVLAKHWPEVGRHGDVQTYRGERGSADVVCGGSPCQDISVAGKRAGLAGERSRLFHEFVRIADEVAPEWLLFENVDSLLGSQDGRDFRVVLRELTGFEPEIPTGGWRSSGACWGPKRAVAWRLFDSQYFGVAQRRHRLFVIGHARAERAFAVLHEPESCAGDPAPRDEEAARPADGTTPRVASTLGSLTGGIRTTDIESETYVPIIASALGVTQRVAHALTASGGPGQKSSPSRMMDEDVNLVAIREPFAFQPRVARNGRGAPASVVPALTAEAGTTGKGDSAPMVVDVEWRVRRLTITERERVQGFPDGWTCLCGADPYSSTTCTCPDGPRARALGNAVSVPIPLWIGRRMSA